MLDDGARRIQVADHMLTMTYPLVKDPKLLLAVLSNLAQSMEANMTKALQEERIPYSEPLSAYKRYLARKRNVPPETIRAYEEMKATLKEHKESPVSFRRNEKFVICNEGYKLRTLSPETAKKYVAHAKTFHQVNA